ncbi:MAG TPA: cytochrome c [Pyrinomonadaceae bacterium]|nr:cytochrome c [Pyrinomonadaceae bacterium]
MNILEEQNGRITAGVSWARWSFTVLSIVVATILTNGQANAQDDGAKLFETRCYSCHNIGGGDKQGPDLKGVTERQSPDWIAEFVKSPTAMSRKDPVAAELFKKYAPTIMPDQSLSPAELESIIALIKNLTAKNETFVPSGARLSRAIVPADVVAGKELFTGQIHLANGAPSCNSCHTVNGVGALGGGTLGPDLTAVNIKYRDPELISILQSPNFPTMNTIFANHKLTDEEVVQLFAYLQNAKQVNPEANVVPTQAAATTDPGFLILGFGVTTLVLVGLNVFWRKRSHGVRKEMVRRSKI